jgi:hypothetical protein
MLRGLIAAVIFVLSGCVQVDCAQSTTCAVTSTPMVNATATVPVSALPGLP